MYRRLITSTMVMVIGVIAIAMVLNVKQPTAVANVDTKYIKININSGIHHAFARAFNCQHDRAMDPMEELAKNAKYLSDAEIERYMYAWNDAIIQGLKYKAKDINESDGPATAQMWYDMQILIYQKRFTELSWSN